jgi:DNA-nicking Smr family endonuclease
MTNACGVLSPATSNLTAVHRRGGGGANPPPAPRTQKPLQLGAVADMDKRTAQRFKRGDLHIDGRLDLHGMTLDQAHNALLSFVRSAHARGARCVVVVTGKGDPDKGGGRIRREAPLWLNQSTLRPLVLAVTEARTHHGGGGALYVLLKRKRV